MKKRNITLLILVVLALLAGLGIRVYRTFLRRPAPLSAPTLVVRVDSPRLETIIDVVRYVGEVRGDADVELAFRIGGMVTEIGTSEGVRVEVRQRLAALDMSETAFRLEQARHQVARAEIEVAYLHDEYEREVRLFEVGAIPRSHLDQSRFRWQTAEAALQAARATLSEADARHDMGALRAPSNGVITAVHVLLGEVVAPGQPVMSLSAGPRVVAVDVLESDWGPDMAEGARAWMSGVDGYEYEGRVRRSDYVARPPFRTVRVHFSFPNDALADYPVGASVSVRIVRGTRGNVLTVPVSAVDLRDGGARVFRIQPDGRVEPVAVTLGARHGARIEVEGPLSLDDRIAASGVTRLAAGVLVEAAQEGQP